MDAFSPSRRKGGADAFPFQANRVPGRYRPTLRTQGTVLLRFESKTGPTAHGLVAGDDQVIEHADIDELQRIAQVAGDYTKCCKPHL